MLRILRTARQGLFNQESVPRYLKYAIGEIALVDVEPGTMSSPGHWLPRQLLRPAQRGKGRTVAALPPSGRRSEAKHCDPDRFRDDLARQGDGRHFRGGSEELAFDFWAERLRERLATLSRREIDDE